MKKINLFSLTFIVLFAVANALVGCSADNEVVTTEKATNSIDEFLTSYYEGNYRLGKSVDVKASSLLKRTATTDYYVFTEVFVGNEKRARGYNITNKSDNNFVYFVDVDRVNYIFTTIDILTGERAVEEQINELDDYYNTNEYDFIQIIESGQYEQPEEGQIGAKRKRITYGRPFIGVDGYCHQGVFETPYFLGFKVGKPKPVLDSDGSTAQVLCGQEWESK